MDAMRPTMFRRRCAAALGALAALLAACRTPQPRNLLLVVIDTCRTDRLSVYGAWSIALTGFPS